MWRSLAIALMTVAGCSESNAPPSNTGGGQSRATSGGEFVYAPATFRQDPALLIDERRYEEAIDFLRHVDLDRQIEADGNGYVAVAEYAITLPGVDRFADYDRARDWVMPGTSDVIESGPWQEAATRFARRYNQRRHAQLTGISSPDVIIAQALDRLLQRPEGAFLIIEEQPSKKFVQFSGSSVEPVILDLPAQPLSEEDELRAREPFRELAAQAAHEVEIAEQQDGEANFMVHLGQDREAAVEIAMRILYEVYLFDDDLQLVLTEE